MPASGASGQPWSAQVASLSSGRWAAVKSGVQDDGERGQTENRPGDPGAHVTPPGRAEG